MKQILDVEKKGSIQYWRFIASKWAAKEATYKAIGKRGVTFPDIFVSHDLEGKPFLIFEKTAKRAIEDKKITHSHISISHDGDYTIANVILEKRKF